MLIEKIYPRDIFGFLVVMSFFLLAIIEFRTLLSLIGFSPNTTLYGIISGVFLVVYTLGFIYKLRIYSEDGSTTA